MSRATVTNDKTGLSQNVYVAPISWLSTVADAGPDGVTIATDHTFAATPADAGFVKLYALPKSTEANGETNGDPGALNLIYKMKGFLPGDDAATQVMLSLLRNEDLIVLYEDAQCPDGAVYQLGNCRMPASVISVKPSSGKKGDGQKGWEIEFEATERYFYQGVITKMA